MNAITADLVLPSGETNVPDGIPAGYRRCANPQCPDPVRRLDEFPLWGSGRAHLCQDCRREANRNMVRREAGKPNRAVSHYKTQPKHVPPELRLLQELTADAHAAGKRSAERFTERSATPPPEQPAIEAPAHVADPSAGAGGFSAPTSAPEPERPAPIPITPAAAIEQVHEVSRTLSSGAVLTLRLSGGGNLLALPKADRELVFRLVDLLTGATDCEVSR